MTKEEETQGALALVRQFVPELAVVKKSDSKLHKLIGRVLAKVGNKSYMESYATTIGTTIAIPTGNDMSWTVALHEGRHVLDFKRWGHLFSVGYLFPQLLGILGVLASLLVSVLVLCGFSPWLLLVLLSLVFLAPLPAPFRAMMEARAYLVTIGCLFWSNRLKEDWLVTGALATIFSTGGYYWMWPFKKMVARYFTKKLEALKADKLELDPYLAACRIYAGLLKQP